MAEYVVGSKMAADAGYGQNGYDGPACSCPGENVTTGFEASKGNAFVPPNTQTRNVSAAPLATRVGRGVTAQWK